MICEVLRKFWIYVQNFREKNTCILMILNKFKKKMNKIEKEITKVLKLFEIEIFVEKIGFFL